MKRACVLLADHARLVVKLTALAFAFTQMASAADLYVTTNGTGDGSSWSSPTNSIQGAIDAISGTYPTNTVWVSNGVYEVGGVTNYPTGYLLTNRVAITKAITVRSANNDPTNTIIKGAWDPATTNGPAAVRCVYMVNGSSLIGFTLTNGATLSATAGGWDQYGGGVVCQSKSATISNCVIAGNSAIGLGGGAFFGTLYNSTIVGNSAGTVAGGSFNARMYNCRIVGNSSKTGGGGAYNDDGISPLYNCMIVSNSVGVNGSGGGVSYGVASNCTFIGNSTKAGGYGGGANSVNLYNCLFVGNSATDGGAIYDYGNGVGIGAAYLLYNCTIISNSATDGGGGICTRVGNITLVNCIMYFNTGNSVSNYYQINAGDGFFNFTNSCTAPSYAGWTAGNITSDPLFVGKDTDNYRLSKDSPCVNTGTNQDWWMTGAVDLDGRQRIRYGTVDMGAYERIYEGTVVIVK